MNGNQNIIHSSSFNFEYSTKASASRGNILIESIFNSHILPELEKAISNRIPEGVRIELSKLEINIGIINEKDLSENLAGRIRKSLEDALNFNFGYNNESGAEVVFEEQKPDSFLIKAIEIFFIKGYFPFEMDLSVTVDELVKRAIHQNKNNIVEVLFKHRNKEQVIRRIAQNLSPKTFNEILISLDPVNSNWISEFSEIMIKLKKELNLNQYSDSEFIQTVNYFILKYVLNQTSLTFNKEKFSSHILKEVIDNFKPDPTLLIKAIQKYKGKTLVFDGLNEPFAKLQEDKKPNQTDDRIQRLSTEQIIKILNGSIDFETNNLNFLKDEIILAIRDKEKREFLIEKLNDSGVANVLRLFDKENPLEILQLISSFVENFTYKYFRGVAEEKAITLNKFVLNIVLYLHENLIRKPG